MTDNTLDNPVLPDPTEIITVTFSIYKNTAKPVTSMVGLVAKVKDLTETAEAAKSLLSLLRIRKACHIKYEDAYGIVVSGPRSELGKFLK